MRVLRIAMFVFAIGMSQHVLAAAFSFVPGHYYTTYGLFYSPQIDEFDATGKFVASLYVPGFQDLSSLSFGPDQRLYVAARGGSYPVDTFSVLAINSHGVVEQQYPSPIVNVGGQFAFDNAGHFYQDRLRFEIGNPNSGSTFLSHGSYGLAVLPNGNFAAADELAIYELDPEGAVIRKVFDAQPIGGYQIGGLAYDPESNSIYTHMVHGGYDLLRIDFSTGKIIQSVPFYQGSDLFLTAEGFLLSGAIMSSSQLLTRDLETQIRFRSQWVYGTQFVPEPSGFVLAGIGVAALCAFTRTARASGSSRQSRWISRRRWRLRCR